MNRPGDVLSFGGASKFWEMNQQIAATDQQRRALEKQPPLPGARNRLVGRWQSATSKPAANADPFARISAMLTGCGVLIGDEIVEFEANRWAGHDSDRAQ